MLAIAVMLATVIGVLLLTKPGSAAKPDLEVTVTPASESAQPRSAVTYSITVTANGGFSGVVGLNVADVPVGVTGTFSANAVAFDKAHRSATAILTLTIGPGTLAGADTFRIDVGNGASGSSIYARLTVTPG
jgi:hypothetical protein